MAKRLYGVYILEVLKKYSSKDNYLNYSEIIEYVKKDYPDVTSLNRKAVANNISELKANGFPIEPVYSSGKSEDEVEESDRIIGSYYNQAEISDSELRILADYVLTANFIDVDSADNTFTWILSHGTSGLRRMYSGIDVCDFGHHTSNYNIMEQYDIINKGIAEKKKIMFDLYDFDIHEGMKCSKKDITVSPYRFVYHNMNYYLIAVDEASHSIKHYRGDKLKNVHLLSGDSIPITQADPTFDFSKYVSEKIYMQTGKPKRIRIKVKLDQVSAIYDYFGDLFKIIEENEDTVTVEVVAEPSGVKYWALQYGKYVEIVSPQELRDELRNLTISMSNNYSVTDEDRYHQLVIDAKIGNGRGRHSLDLFGINLEERTEYRYLTQLTELRIGRNGDIDYSFIEDLKNLRFLTAVNCVEDIAKLRLNIDSLERFSLTDHIALIPHKNDKTTHIENLECIKGCRNLQHISVDDIFVDDISAIYDFPELERVRVSSEQFKKIDLTKFKEEPTVETFGRNKTIVELTFKETRERHMAINHPRRRNLHD